ncbi:hypothetical protein AKO1_014870 [Acrasis kona]|uniref:Golgi apparatus membrane protein TVP23 homolog n=1 Tax=Acrasis kona TaxID=1008807 RepID=A0AAW2YZN0_9EUKA
MTDIEKGNLTTDTFPGDEDDNATPATSFLTQEERYTAVGSSGNKIEDAREFIRTTYNQGCPCGHPIATFFHLFFKVGALFVYFWSMFATSFVIPFVICILFISFDFWTVKNITGRLMVGLRWWNEVQEDGSNVWRFESRENLDDVAQMDSYFFWVVLYAQPVLWVLILIVSILLAKPSWFFVNALAIVLGSFNAWGYFKCQKGKNIIKANTKNGGYNLLWHGSWL